ncbi:MAG: peptide ABC transporter substrate-binding protein [Bacillota bacterium]|nr:peptide ABC transporter substrate-binding protein [Bacillota bacterium]
MKKKFISMLIIICSLNMLLTSCSLRDSIKIDNSKKSESIGYAGDIMDKGPVRGGALRTFSTIPDTLNPILTNNLYVKDFSQFIFESLVKLDKSQRPVPVLADKWEVSKDGLTWTFYLRNNISWHNNTPFTADDVEFTIKSILDPKISSVYKKNLEDVSAYSAVDKRTIKLILKQPNSFLAELMTFPIISKSYFNGEDLLTTKKNDNPIGTGPYKFVSSDGKSQIKLALDEKWWRAAALRKDQTLPLIAEINIVLENNTKDALNDFQDDKIDVAFIKNRDFSKFSGRTDVFLKKFPSNNYEFISLNLTNPVLQDKIVRQAMAYAIDKVKLIDKIMPGEAIAADIPVIPDTWLYETNALSYVPSSKSAKDLLTQNGWKEDPKTGTMYKAIGGYYRKLEFEILVNEDDDIRYRVADMIANQLEACGITLKVTKIKWEDEFKRIYSKNYDLALLGWSIPDYSDVSYAFSSDAEQSSFNISGYKNPEIDGYLTQIKSENDDSKKKTMFFNMRSIISDEMPYIGLFFYNNAVLFNKRVRGDLSSYQWDKYSDITKWYITAPVK